MAEQINTTKVRMGTVIPVRNLKQKFGAADVYYAVKVESEAGNPEMWLLLTAGELNRLPAYDCGDWADGLKKGRLYPFSKVGTASNKYILNIRATTGKPDEYKDRTVIIGERLLSKSALRAAQNPEDIPEQDLLSDLLD